MFRGKKRVGERGRFLGIDESNHCKSPEIYVAVFFTKKKDIEDKLHIEKSRKNKNICDILCGRDFRYIIIPREHKEILGSGTNIMTVVFTEFIKYFKDLDSVFIDGNVPFGVLINVENFLYPRSCPKLIGIPKADSKYPIVNIADRVANLLFRHHTQEGSKNKIVGQYLEHLITPRLEDYANLIEVED